MDCCRAVKHDCARQAVPNIFSVAQTFFGRRERNEPERMIDKMGRDVGEENEARRHAQVPPPRPDEEACEEFLTPQKPETGRMRQRHRSSHACSPSGETIYSFRVGLTKHTAWKMLAIRLRLNDVLHERA